MDRIYFMAPDVDCAKRVVDDLLLARIEQRYIHVIAKDGIPLEGLPTASFFKKCDMAHALEQGLALGGASGMVAGLVAISLPSAGLVLGGGAILLATTLAGASIGTFGAILRAVNIPNTRFKEYEQDLENGRILILVDVPKEKANTVRQLIQKKHGEIRNSGVKPRVAHPFP
jgi:hypothetical protein